MIPCLVVHMRKWMGKFWCFLCFGFCMARGRVQLETYPGCGRLLFGA